MCLIRSSLGDSPRPIVIGRAWLAAMLRIEKIL